MAFGAVTAKFNQAVCSQARAFQGALFGSSSSSDEAPVAPKKVDAWRERERHRDRATVRHVSERGIGVKTLTSFHSMYRANLPRNP